MKTLISKTTKDGDVNTEEFLVGLLEWRNTPREEGLSPAEILLGHPMRSRVPTHSSRFDNRWKKMDMEWDRRRSSVQTTRNKWYNATARPLKKI